MTSSEISWLSEDHFDKLFKRFPLPLAILGDTGAVKLLNNRFTGIFDADILNTATLQSILQNPDKPAQAVILPRLDGSPINALARAIKAGSNLFLVLEISDEDTHHAQLAELHLRLAELEMQSSTDRLTGAWNRAHFDKTISAELARSVRYKQPITLILFDIDHFKRVNDCHGHAIGDVALRELAKVITQNIRTSDMLFRWGGEEFAVLAPSTPYRSAAGLAETLRGKVEIHPIEQAGHITVSLGVAEHFTGESKDVWFQRADAALYKAKKSGRNRVVVDELGSSDLWSATAGRAILYLSWHDSYNCGDPAIDEDHRQLFDLSNDLIDASFRRSENPEVFSAALNKLLEHVKKHFADEEKILASRHYPGLEAQKHAHVRLMERALQLKADVETGGVTTGELLEFLASEVVARHMLQTDREFYPLFAAAQVVADAAA